MMQMNAREFMAELYRDVSADKVTYLYTLPRKQCLPYKISHIDQMLEKAAALSDVENIYWGLHLMDEAPTKGKRACAETISSVSFLHGEYDL